MSSNTFKLAVALAIVSLAVCPSEAIKCWQCNTVNAQFCNDVPAGPVGNVSHLPSCFQEMYKECPDNGDKLPYTFCRKIEQTIKEEKRVIRSCGFDKSSQDCYQTKTPSVMTKVCQCFSDGCNSAGQVTLSLATIIAALLLNRFFINY